MNVWIVTQWDGDFASIVAVYASEAMASEHVALMGGAAEECEVRETLHPDAVDPVKQAERAAEAARQKQQWIAYQEAQARDTKARAEARPNPPHMRLCHCDLHRIGDWGMKHTFINAHGYCGYCGGFTFEVFRAEMGEQALQAAIDELDLWRREKMRQLVSPTPTKPGS